MPQSRQLWTKADSNGPTLQWAIGQVWSNQRSYGTPTTLQILTFVCLEEDVKQCCDVTFSIPLIGLNVDQSVADPEGGGGAVPPPLK